MVERTRNGPQSQETDTAAQFDPSLEDFPRHRYAYYRRFREHDPVHRSKEGDGSKWYVFRHEDVVACLKDRRFTRRPPENAAARLPTVPRGAQPILDVMSKWMLFQDPPDHTRSRALLGRTFTSTFIARLKPRIETIAASLLENVDRAAEFDLVSSYAFPLPIVVITEMLGIPPEDRQYFRGWSLDIVSAADKPATAELLTRASSAIVRMESYFGDIIAHRRRHPSQDLIGELVRHEGEKVLQASEVVAMCTMLLSTGFETTGDLIGNAVLALLRHPQQQQRIRNDPTLLASGIEELTRYDGPVQSTARYASDDIVVGGRQLRRGDCAVLVIGSANRDERRFEDPDTLELTRSVAHNVAFGMGIHFCLGYALAKLEAQIALCELFNRYPDLQLREASPEWKPGVSFAGLKRLMVGC